MSPDRLRPSTKTVRQAPGTHLPPAHHKYHPQYSNPPEPNYPSYQKRHPHQIHPHQPTATVDSAAPLRPRLTPKTPDPHETHTHSASQNYPCIYVPGPPTASRPSDYETPPPHPPQPPNYYQSCPEGSRPCR